MKINSYNHRNGESVIPLNIQNNIKEILMNITSPITNKGASKIRMQVVEKMHLDGWSENIRLTPSSHMTITAMKDKIGACVQLGNVSRLYADLMKLQTLFLRGSINAGIIIVPEIEAAKELGQNIANSVRLIKELQIFDTLITMPLIIYGFDK